MKTTPKIGKVSAINLVDDTTEMMLISQFGKIIRIDTKTIRSAGRSTSGVKLLNLDTDDKVAAAVVIPPEDAKTQPEERHPPPVTFNGNIASPVYRKGTGWPCRNHLQLKKGRGLQSAPSFLTYESLNERGGRVVICKTSGV